MRWVYGFLVASALLVVDRPASAQIMNWFRGSQGGITTGSSYGYYPGGYTQTSTGYATPLGYAATPGTYYSSGYYASAPGTVVSGPGVNPAAPNGAVYKYSAPVTTSVYSPYWTYATRRGWFRRGLFGRRLFGRRVISP